MNFKGMLISDLKHEQNRLRIRWDGIEARIIKLKKLDKGKKKTKQCFVCKKPSYGYKCLECHRSKTRHSCNTTIWVNNRRKKR